MIKSLLFQIVRKCIGSITGEKSKLSGVEYWEQRARQYGRRSVIDIRHSEDEIEAVTKMQKEKIFPFFKQYLKGDEKLILDFGCGPGRFTRDLARMIQGRAIGVDPIKHLIDLAPKGERVEYMLVKDGIIPLDDSSVDIVWICHVLGGIINKIELNNTISEVNRVLKKGGLIFLVENTSEKKDGEYWKYRSVQTYQRLFNTAELQYISDYFEFGERSSVMAGRKR